MEQCIVSIPPGFNYHERALKAFQRKFPHTDRNVFVMMPFSASTTLRIFSAVAKQVEAHGLIPLRADIHKFSDILWWNVMTYMVGSSYGIAIYEPHRRINFNPNVSIEAGFMTALDRPVLLLANSRLKRLPIDFSGHIFKTYDSTRLTRTISSAVADWIEKDLSFCDYGGRKLLVFVSLGGTCRCVIAKGIMSKFLADRKISGLAVEAAAVADPHNSTVSPSAMNVLRESQCETFLEGHRPRKMCRFLQDRADLIIALTDAPLARTSASSCKLKTSKDILGTDIINPYPDKGDEASLTRYRRCFKQLETALDRNFDRILDKLGATPSL